MGTEERRQRERAARQAMILDAAERVIAERGFWATTMDDVAAAAELSKGTLYLYFSNKDALCAALAARTMAPLASELEGAMQGQSTGLGKLRAALQTNARFMGRHPHLMRMAVSWILTGIESADSSEFAAYRKHVASITGLALEAIEQGRRDGSIRPDVDARVTALALWSGMLGSLLAAASASDLSQRLPFSVRGEDLLAFYIGNTLRGLAPRDGANKTAEDNIRETIAEAES